MWNLFLTSNSGTWRTLRTIVQGVLGVCIANVDILVQSFSFSADQKAIVVALTMAILSPLMKALGTDADLREIDEMAELESEE